MNEELRELILYCNEHKMCVRNIEFRVDDLLGGIEAEVWYDDKKVEKICSDYVELSCIDGKWSKK